MNPPFRTRTLLGCLVLFLAAALPSHAGQLTWTPGGELPTLTLNLGDGPVKRTLTLPSGAAWLDLTLRPFLLDNTRVILVWKSDGVLWLRQKKKIPGAGTTTRMALPPGRLITVDITTEGGTPAASIRLQRN